MTDIEPTEELSIKEQYGNLTLWRFRELVNSHKEALSIYRENYEKRIKELEKDKTFCWRANKSSGRLNAILSDRIKELEQAGDELVGKIRLVYGPAIDKFRENHSWWEVFANWQKARGAK